MKSVKPIIFGFLCLLLAGNFALAQNDSTPTSKEPSFFGYISRTQASPALRSQDTSSLEMAQIPGTEQMRRIRVLSPNGGEQWEKGKSYTIRWTSGGNIPEVKIVLKWGPGVGIWIPVADRVPNTGEYAYTIPETVKQEGSEFMVIVMSSDGLISDSSDSPFTILTAKAEPKPVPMISPAAPVIPKLIDGKTLKAVETGKGKSLRIKYYEIQEARGYTEEELKEVEAELAKQKIAVAQSRIEKRIEEVVRKKPMARILIPLLYHRLEEQSQKPLLMAPAPRVQAREVSPPAQIDVRPHLQTSVQIYKQISPSLKSQYFHPTYAELKPGQTVDRVQLGKDILQAMRPNYENEIRQIIRKSFAPGRPKFRWDSAQFKKAQELKRTMPAGSSLRPAFPQLQKAEVDALMARYGGPLSPAAYDRLQKMVEAQRISAPQAMPGQIHRYLVEKAGLRPNEIPDLNRDYVVRNYYEYHVALDSFYPANFNETWDEPYWQIVASIPQYDANDPELMHLLSNGDLYKVEGRITGSYDVDDKKTYRFRAAHRDVLYANTYNTSASFIISLWEEDWSKDIVKGAAREALKQLEDKLREEVQEAVFAVVQNFILEVLMEQFPLVGDLISQLLQAARIGTGIDFVALLQGVSAAYGEIDISWLLLAFIYGGGDIGAFIESSFLACPEVTIALIALQVAGPIVIDLLKGNFRDALNEFLCLPISIFKFIIDIFSDFKELILAILAACDRDDFIQTNVITITKSVDDDIFQDADWGLGAQNYAVFSVDRADDFYRKHGWGPTDENNNMIKINCYWQPVLTFESRSGDTKYEANYNVKRTLVGGRETIGYTIKNNPQEFQQKKRYEAKGSGKIRVLVSALNTAEAVPIVNIYTVSGRHPVSANNIGIPNPREFYIEAYPGVEYELQIATLGMGDFYGYVTLEEKGDRIPLFIFLSQITEANPVIYGLPNSIAAVSRRDLLYLLPGCSEYFKIVPGLADPQAISFESITYPGYYLRHQNFRLNLHKKTEDQLFKEDATFLQKSLLSCERRRRWVHDEPKDRRPGDRWVEEPGGHWEEDPNAPLERDKTGVAFESYNYPNYFIYTDGSNLILKQNTDECKRSEFRRRTYFNQKLDRFISP